MEKVKQTGLLIKYPSPNDYIAGGISGIPMEERLLLGDWELYLPTIEKQYRNGLFYSFDTMSCVTFTALNMIEMQVNYFVKNGLIDEKSLQYLKDAGYFDENGYFNCSDKFTAIMSETTIYGNYFYKVWDSIRKDGVLPEKDLPFGDAKNFGEYHSVYQITDSMKEKAKKILDIFDFKYEWVFFDDNKDMSVDEKSRIEQALKQCPLEIGIPIPASHAISLVDVDGDVFTAFDNYDPHTKTWITGTTPIHFAMKGYVGVKIKNNNVKYTFTKDLKFGMTDTDIIYLQKILNKDNDTLVSVLGQGSSGRETNYFGPATQKAVVAFQKKHKIVPYNGYVGPKTRAKLNELHGNGDIPEIPKQTPHIGKIDAWCEAIKVHEGYFVGSRSYRNKNPGNLKHVGQKRAIGKDDKGFCIFATYQDGYDELKDMLVRCASGNSTSYRPTMNLLEFFEVYAPASDNNVPFQYAKTVARRLGVDITIQIKNLL